MLASVLPGLRELRAPLAAGYLWLLVSWLIFGDEFPTSTEPKSAPFDRLYRLEPVVAGIGLAVVASVAAYLLGSITIDVQVRLGRTIGARLYGRSGLQLTSAGARLLEPWVQARADEVRDEITARSREARQRISGARTEVEHVRAELEKTPPTIGVERGRRAIDPEGSAALPSAREAPEEHHRAVMDRSRKAAVVAAEKDLEAAERYARQSEVLMEAARTPRLHQAVRVIAGEHIDSNRDLLKTRLLDTSQPLHSEIDRPDAEATFRMALWLPVSVLCCTSRSKPARGGRSLCCCQRFWYGSG